MVAYHASARWIPGGFTGVDIFFVISGYLIGGHIYSELSAGTFTYSSFYRRRAKRILPAFYVVLAFTLMIAVFLLSPPEAQELGKAAMAATLSVSNVLFWRTLNYFNPTNERNLMAMTWSLGVEEQFYAVIPILMALLVRVRRSLVLPAIAACCAISFALAWYQVGHDQRFAFFMLPARAWELGAGVVLAVAELSRRRFKLSGIAAELGGICGFVLLGAPLFLLSGRTPFPGVAVLPSVLGSVMVIATPTSFINRYLLTMRPLVFVGRVSYSFYLWHWPLLALLRIVSMDKPSSAMIATTVAAAFGAAVLSYFLIEQPFRRSRSAAVPLLVRYALLSAVIVAVYAAVWRSGGIPQRFPALAKAAPRIYTDGNTRAFEPGKNGTLPVAALWGDSHAEALFPGLRDAARASGYELEPFTKAGCPPLTGVSVYNPLVPKEEQACYRFNAGVLRQLQADQRIRLVVLASFWEFPLRPTIAGQGDNRWWLVAEPATSHAIPSLETSRTMLRDAVIASIAGLQGAGKQVIVMGDVPSFDFHPQTRAEVSQTGARRALVTWLAPQDAGDPGVAAPIEAPEAEVASAAMREASQARGVELVNLRAAMCPAEHACLYRVGETLLYQDHQHLSVEGSRYALRNFQFAKVAH